jgi:hypothetical protein
LEEATAIAAFETCRDAHHAPNAAYFEAQLPAARVLVGSGIGWGAELYNRRPNFGDPM